MKSMMYMPIYNQMQEFPRVLDELKSVDLPCDTLLIVNNGSDDGCEKLVRKSGYPYIELKENRGVGFSNMIALDWALERGYEVFGTMASNGKMLPAEMHRLYAPVFAGEVDYTTGSRYMTDGSSPNLPTFRRNAIPLVNVFVKMFTGKTVTDATCGYRAYKIDIIRSANFNWHSPWLYTYAFEYYLYAKVLNAKRFRCCEVPVTMRYPKTGPYSKIPPFKGWYAMLKPWVVACFDGKGFHRKY